MPLPYLEKLRPLTDALPPKPFSDIQQSVLEELGISSLSETFSFFDETPLATASIAQVHRATLIDGTDVVVKVQHRNVAEKVRQDLQNLSHIVELLARYDPEWDLRPVLDEWAAELPAELDFKREAANMAEVETAINDFQRSLDKLAKIPPLWAELGLSKDDLSFSVRLPKVIPKMVREKVLLLEYVDGIRLSEVDKLKERQVDLPAMSKAITQAYGFQLFTTGIFNADPHSGNFLIAPANPSLPIDSKTNPWQPVLLDFGLTKHLTSLERLGLSRMLISASEVDYSGLLSSLEEIGLKLNIDEPEASMDVVRFLFRRGEARDDAIQTNKEKRKEWEKAEEERKQQQKKSGTKQRRLLEAFPSCLILFGRVLNLLRGVSTGMGAKENYLEGLTPFAKVGLVGDFESSALKEDTGSGKVWDTVAKLKGERRLLGLQVSVRQNGKEREDLSVVAGHMGKFDPRPYTKDTLTNVYSATKPVVATAVHLLVKDGACKYDDLVVKFWPEFAKPGTPKAATTIAQLISHRAGLQDAATQEIALDPFIMRDWNKMIKLMEDAEPHPEPGKETRYHYFSFGWLVGGLVEKVAKKPVMDFINERIFSQLGFTTPENSLMFIGIPAKGVDTRLASVVWDLHEVRAMFSRATEDQDKKEENESGFGVGTIEDLVEQEENRSPAELVEAPTSAPIVAPADQPNGDAKKPFDLRTALRTDPRMQTALLTSNPTMFNQLRLRRAVVPSANGHFSAFGMSQFYMEIANGFEGADKSAIKGVDPTVASKMVWGADSSTWTATERALGGNAGEPPSSLKFKVTQAQLNDIAKEVTQQLVGGGFMRYFFVRPLKESEKVGEEDAYEITVGLGHAGFGGSVGLALPTEKAGVALVVNKLDVRGTVTRELLDAVGEELGIGKVAQFGANLLGGEEGQEVNAELNPFGRMV